MSAPPANAIEVSGLVKRFGDFVAVNGLDLVVRRGELLSLLGPNGAGKSTTLSILTTLMPASVGRVVIAGHEVPRQNDLIRPLVGLVPQEIALYGLLTARWNLRFFGRLYGLRGAERERHVNALLRGIELADRADHLVYTLSGGMQRRVNIAAALVHDPDIIFLDEPTVGLDPNSRAAIWKIIRELKARGKTLVLTTHYMEEAEALSDRVAIVDHGKVVAIGTSAELVQATGMRTCLNVAVAGDGAACVEPLRALEGVKQVVVDGSRLQVYTDAGSQLLPHAIEVLLKTGMEVRSVEVVLPDLEAAFLHYTGRKFSAVG